MTKEEAVQAARERVTVLQSLVDMVQLTRVLIQCDAEARVLLYVQKGLEKIYGEPANG
jgi:hypothetical protein